MVVLKRVDPEANMNRTYMVTVQPTLLDTVAVVYAWGSRESSQLQVRVPLFLQKSPLDFDLTNLLIPQTFPQLAA